MERKIPLLIQFLKHPTGVRHSIKPSELVTGIFQTQRLESTNNLYEPSLFWYTGLCLFYCLWYLKLLRETCLCISSDLPFVKKGLLLVFN